VSRDPPKQQRPFEQQFANGRCPNPNPRLSKPSTLRYPSLMRTLSRCPPPSSASSASSSASLRLCLCLCLRLVSALSSASLLLCLCLCLRHLARHLARPCFCACVRVCVCRFVYPDLHRPLSQLVSELSQLVSNRSATFRSHLKLEADASDDGGPLRDEGWCCSWVVQGQGF